MFEPESPISQQYGEGGDLSIREIGHVKKACESCAFSMGHLFYLSTPMATVAIERGTTDHGVRYTGEFDP